MPYSKRNTPSGEIVRPPLMTRRLAAEEGIFAGGSSSKIYNAAWMREEGFLPAIDSE